MLHQDSAVSQNPDTIALAARIDHTLLRADARGHEIDRYCREAAAHGFAAVCVNSGFAARTAAYLEGSGVATCAVVGFPLGATLTTAKQAEAEAAVAVGADELDMVLAISALKDGEYATVARDIQAVRRVCPTQTLKVILETCLLTRAEKIRGCELAVAAGADFVKTSTGFATAGATVADVRLMRETVGSSMGVKASGGIRSRADARAMIEAGATRIGASSGVALLAESPA